MSQDELGQRLNTVSSGPPASDTANPDSQPIARGDNVRPRLTPAPSKPAAAEPAEAMLRRYAERFRILHELDEAILGARSPEAIAVSALSRVRLLIPYGRGSVVAFIAAQAPEVLAALGAPDFPGDLATWIGLLPQALAQQPHIQGTLDLGAVEQHSPLQKELYEAGIRSYIVVPLLAQDGVLGALALESDRPDAFTAEQVDTAAEVGGLVAVALQQAQLRTSLQDELAERRLAQLALQTRETALREYAAELEARNAELDAFAHTVAHDLKNPLTVLMGYTDLLTERSHPVSADDEAESLRLIRACAVKMKNIINELLLLASVRRMEDVPLDSLDMERIVAEAWGRLSGLAVESRAEITFPVIWPVAKGYAPWIEEVWANYLSNALKYGGRPPRLDLGAELLPADAGSPPGAQRMIRFWLRDNGLGLSDEEQGHLFLPFNHGQRVKGTGHGLGLSIVQRIVDKLGGQVGVESSPGQGSVFYFTLPAVDPHMRPRRSRRFQTAPLPAIPPAPG